MPQRRAVDAMTTEAIVGVVDPAPREAGRSPDIDDEFGAQGADIVDEWGRQSFPASDPPSNW
jgi:hypothetical protein